MSETDDATAWNATPMSSLRNILAFYRLDNPFKPDDNNYWRLRLINIFLILTTFVYVFFTLFNLLVTRLYANATVDIIGLVTIHAILLNYHRKRRVEETSHYITLSVFILSAAVIMVADKDYGILFWSIFLPIFAMMLMGRRIGLYYSVAYYGILIAHLIGSTDKGVSPHVILEFAIVSIVLLAIVYYYESSRIEAYQRLQHQTLHDPLTGLYNRRYFDAIFTTEFHRLRRNGKPFAFFMMDVDYFKDYNDFYGHHEGDLALRAVASILNAHLRRPGDVAFRLGGEEFGAITSCQDNAQCIQYVEQIRTAIQDLKIVHEAKKDDGVLTASFGYIVINDYNGIDPEQVYKLADKALYKAKAGGRNRIETVNH